MKLGKEEGAELLCGGEVNKLEGDLAGGYYIQPTLFKGHNKMRIFQEEIFGPVVCVTTFKTTEEAAHPDELTTVSAYYQMNPENDDRPIEVKVKIKAREEQEAALKALVE